MSFSLTTGIIKYIISNMASLSANTLLFASETGKEGGDILLIFTVSPGHQVLAANKAKGLAVCSPTLVLLGK